MIDGVPERLSHPTQRDGRHHRSLRVKPPGHDIPAFTLFTQPIGHRHRGIIKIEVTIVHAIKSGKIILSLYGETLGAFFDDEGSKVFILRPVFWLVTGLHVSHI